MEKSLIKKKEVKIQLDSTAMALTSPDTLIKPDKPPAKKKQGQKINGGSMSCAWNGDVLYSGLTETVMCHMWCDTGVSRVV